MTANSGTPQSHLTPTTDNLMSITQQLQTQINICRIQKHHTPTCTLNLLIIAKRNLENLGQFFWVFPLSVNTFTKRLNKSVSTSNYTKRKKRAMINLKQLKLIANGWCTKHWCHFKVMLSFPKSLSFHTFSKLNSCCTRNILALCKLDGIFIDTCHY